MANEIITPSIIAKEALVQLENNMVFGNIVHRDYKQEFKKVGATVDIRKPVKFHTVSGAALSKQDVTEGTTNITIDKQEHVAFEFTTADQALSIEQYSERYIKPGMIALANTMDRDIASLYSSVWNWVGTPGQTINSFADLSKGPERLDEMAVQEDGRIGALAPRDRYGLAATQTGLFSDKLSIGAYESARLGDISGAMTYATQNVRNHTVGALGGTPLVDGANQNVTYSTARNTNTQTLNTDGWSNSVTGVLKKGDVFTVAGVYAVNPVPARGTDGKDVLDFLQQFVVTADADSDGSGDAALTISPAIITTGPYQTVSAAPADNAAITVVGSAATAYRSNLVMHKNAFALAICDLEPPNGGAKHFTQRHNGLSVRVVEQYDINTDANILRMDVLYGVKAIYPDLATRISGTA